MKTENTTLPLRINKVVQLDLIRFNNNVVTKSNDFIELPYRLSLNEQKIILFMISLARREDSDFSLFRFSARELMDFLDIRTTSYAQIASTIHELKKKSIFIGENDSVLDVNWLSSARYFPG